MALTPLERVKRYQARHRERVLAAARVRDRVRYAARREEIRARCRAWYEKNRDRAAANTRRNYLANKERAARSAKEWAARNPEKAKTARSRAWKNWADNNKAVLALRNRLSDSLRKMATPAWAIRFFMDEAYNLAALRTKLTGFLWHVDHIVPLKSKVVCGLHVHNNLRVIPAVDNIRKGNRAWPDMPSGRVDFCNLT